MPFFRVTSFRVVVEKVVNDVEAQSLAEAYSIGDKLAIKSGKVEDRDVHVPSCSTNAEQIAVHAR